MRIDIFKSRVHTRQLNPFARPIFLLFSSSHFLLCSSLQSGPWVRRGNKQQKEREERENKKEERKEKY